MEIANRSYSDGPLVDNKIHDPDFVYDENGNLLEEPADGSETSKRYVFDATNRLREVWMEGDDGFIPVSLNVYEAGGMRIARQQNADGGRLTYYFRSPEGPVLAEYVVDRGAWENPYRSKEYLYGMGRILGENDFCGPPPYLEWAGTSYENGQYRFAGHLTPTQIAEAAATSEGCAAVEIEIATASTHHTINGLCFATPDFEFGIAETEFSTTEMNFVRVRARGIGCGLTVWSNDLSVSVNGTFFAGTPPRPFDWAEFRSFHVDHLGSVRIEADSLGVMTSKFDYYPFGREITIPASDATHRFTGHERDLESGLDYMMARHYSSSQARFLGTDPLAGAGLSSSQGWSRHSYVLGNPVIYIDPTGMRTLLSMYAEDGVPAGVWNFFWHSVLFADAQPLRGGWTEHVEVTASAPPPDTPVPATDPCFSVVVANPCGIAGGPGSRFLGRWWRNFSHTNRAIPGSVAPPLMGILTGGALSVELQTLTPVKWLAVGARGGVMAGVRFTALETGVVVVGASLMNAALVGVTYEAGVGVGSTVNALPVYGPEASVGDWWSERLSSAFD